MLRRANDNFVVLLTTSQCCQYFVLSIANWAKAIAVLQVGNGWWTRRVVVEAESEFPDAANAVIGRVVLVKNIDAVCGRAFFHAVDVEVGVSVESHLGGVLFVVAFVQKAQKTLVGTGKEKRNVFEKEGNAARFLLKKIEDFCCISWTEFLKATSDARFRSGRNEKRDLRKMIRSAKDKPSGLLSQTNPVVRTK